MFFKTKANLQGTIEEVNNLKSKLEAEREDVRKQERRLKEESWKLKDIEQQLILQNKYFQKMLNVMIFYQIFLTFTSRKAILMFLTSI